MFWPACLRCLFDPDPGFFFRVLGWYQACMLDERRKSLEVFPQALHLPKGHEHQPVLPHHHPPSGTWTNTNTHMSSLCTQLSSPVAWRPWHTGRQLPPESQSSRSFTQSNFNISIRKWENLCPFMWAATAQPPPGSRWKEKRQQHTSS